MSRWSLSKKLHPAKKAWKTFTSKILPKLQTLKLKLKLPKASHKVKTTTRRLLITVRSFRFYIPSKLRLTNFTKSRSTTTWRSNRHYSYYRNQTHDMINNNVDAIHIDELFGESSSSKKTKGVKLYQKEEILTSKYRSGEQGTIEDNKGGSNYENKNNSLCTIEDAWKVVVASSPQLRVDERAEEFICKFREDMKLQKERSMLELQQMFARSPEVLDQ